MIQYVSLTALKLSPQRDFAFSVVGRNTLNDWFKIGLGVDLLKVNDVRRTYLRFCRVALLFKRGVVSFLPLYYYTYGITDDEK